MRPSRSFLLAVCLSAACLIPPRAFSQGTLTPPGPPGPTMKTLDQIDAKLEKRIPINSTTTPGTGTATFRIAAAGSYYLTGNLTGESGKNGIIVDVDNVTIDLNGFSLLGVPGSLNGITVGGVTNRTIVRNGTSRSWGESGILLGLNSAIDHVIADHNGTAGLLLGQGSLIVDCTADRNVGAGIDTSAGSVIRSCAANFNGGVGIISSETALVLHSSARFNGGDGFAIGNRGLIQGCVSTLNTGHGINIESGQVLDCTSVSNMIDGIHTSQSFGVQVERCFTVSNQGDGIEVRAGSTVANCQSKNHGSGAGIRVEDGQATRIDSNNVSDNARGIEVAGDRNIIVRNTCRNNSSRNFVIAAGNRIAQILVPAVNGAAIDGDTGAGTFTSTDPWANFTY